MTKFALFSALLVTTTLAQAAMDIPLEHQIGSISVSEVQRAGTMGPQQPRVPRDSQDPHSPRDSQNDDDFYYGNGRNGGGMGFDGMYDTTTPNDPIERTGQVIQRARDVVALGEEIYNLVQKGKPSNVTEYAPVSVVPREPGTKEPVDAFDLENFSMPVSKNYTVKIKNAAGAVVVAFTYKVVYTYGGSYNGAGKYLAGVIVVPSSVTTKFGWTFNATMKVTGIMNHGTKASPVAGVMLTMKYQMNSWGKAFERNDTIHITGRGEIKNYNLK